MRPCLIAVLLVFAAPALAATVPAKPGATHLLPSGLPRWTPPPAYSEQLIVETDGKTIVMDRKADHGRLRTDMSVEGKAFTMIEVGDEKGTNYMLMPEQKRAMKQSREGLPAGIEGKADTAAAAPVDEGKTEVLGEETIDGVVTTKVRMTTKEGDALAWFDKASGAPVRMESAMGGKKAVLRWKDRKIGPQPDAAFEVPKGYDVMDMDEMRSKMGAMGGMGGGGMGALGGLMKGGGGMMGGLGGGMMGGLGGGLGGMLGGSLGGPLGAMAGKYIGGKIGGALAYKATAAAVGGP